MKFTRSTYPDYPGVKGGPCWTLSGRWAWIDADWNTRFPFGTSLGAYFGPENGRRQRACGLALDLNAPLGEPNRLYLNTRNWHVILGLLTFRRAEFYTAADGTPSCRDGRSWPHLTGCGRYRYHKDATGDWVRNDKPEPMHWGWLTIERKRRNDG